jgi:hypothetical protein
MFKNFIFAKKTYSNAPEETSRNTPKANLKKFCMKGIFSIEYAEKTLRQVKTELFE